MLASPTTETNQHSAFRNFFSYIDDIEARVRLTDSVSRADFEKIVDQVIGSHVDPKEIELFFEVLDRNHNGRLEISELPPLQKQKNESL